MISLLAHNQRIRGRNMLRKMFQGGSSRKQGPRLAMRDADEEPPTNAPVHDADEEPPRDAPVRPCEWPSENFMDRAGIKKNSTHICVTPIL